MIKYALCWILLLGMMIACTKNKVEPEPTQSGLWRYTSGVTLDHPDFFPEAFIRFNDDNTLSGYNSEIFFEGNYLYEGQAMSIHVTNWFGETPSDWAQLFNQHIDDVYRYELLNHSVNLYYSEDQFLTFDRIEECISAHNNPSEYQSGPSDAYQILELHQIENCLEVVMSYAGGCEEVGVTMVGSGAYAESEPPQLNVRLLLDDQDDCEAQIIKLFHFDVQQLQYAGSSELIIHLEGFDQFIRFDFGD